MLSPGGGNYGLPGVQFGVPHKQPAGRGSSGRGRVELRPLATRVWDGKGDYESIKREKVIGTRESGRGGEGE